ncbi:unnamed protein product, partial [Rotaria socialis]
MIEPYVPPTRILRCYNCQQYDDHIAVRCPNKDKPICFKCGQQHSFNPECQNAVCCAHCKGNHMAGNPNCPQKIATRENKKIQMKAIGDTNNTNNELKHMDWRYNSSSVRKRNNNSTNNTKQ